MYKRWLSQALEHAAFPLVVLAVALSQVKTNHHSELSLLQHGRESLELRQSDLAKRSLGEYPLSTPRGSLPAGSAGWQQPDPLQTMGRR
jgi:hypothetical protein